MPVHNTVNMWMESHSEQSPTRRSPPDSIYTPIDKTSDYPVYGDDAMAKVPGQRFRGRPCHHEWRRANGWLPEAKEHEE